MLSHSGMELLDMSTSHRQPLRDRLRKTTSEIPQGVTNYRDRRRVHVFSPSNDSTLEIYPPSVELAYPPPEDMYIPKYQTQYRSSVSNFTTLSEQTIDPSRLAPCTDRDRPGKNTLLRQNILKLGLDAPERLARDSISMSSRAPSRPVSYLSPAADPLGPPSSLPYSGTGAELRYPPVDPRKTRRYCTDFGLGQTEPTTSSPPFPIADPSQLPSHHLQVSTSLAKFADDDGSETSCAGSTPLATYSHTGTDDDSDSDYSEYQDIEFEFPEPPSIKPALRRMQSSPMFTAEETSAVREFLKKRWGAKIKANARSSKALKDSNVQVLTPAKDDSDDEWDGRGHSDFSWEAVSPVRFSFEDESSHPRRPSREDRTTRDLELAGEALLNVDHVSAGPTLRASRGLGYGIPLDNVDIPKGVPDACLGSADVRRQSKVIQSSVGPEPQSHRTLHASTSELSSKPEKAQTRYGRFTPSIPARIPQIIRKVSNLSLRRSRDDLRGEARATVACSQQQQPYHSVLDNLKLAPVTPSAVSMDRLEVSMEKLKAHKPPRHAGSASVSFSPSVDAGRGDRLFPTRSNTMDRITQTPPRQYQYVPGPSLASAGREKPSHRVNHSVPLAGLTNINVTSEPAGRSRSGSASARSVSVNININTNTGATSGHKSLALSDPFLHRPIRSQPMGMVPSSHEMTRLDKTTSASAPMKSFMDMTPEQVRPESVAGMHKERMRKMLARASTGVFGWGKGLGRRKD